VRTRSAPGVGPWLKSSSERSAAKVRLFVFPHAGGAPAAFRTWPDVLAPQVEPHFVALPGRERRFHETPLTRSDEIIAPVATAIASFDDRPFVLFGHSMGSMLAFEVARQLRRSGRRGPAALVVSGRCAPQLKPRTPVLRDLPDSELIRQVARLFGGISAELLHEPELIDLMVGVLRADLTVIESYRYVPEEPLGCSILALGGTDDPWVTEDELEAWRQQTSAGFASAQFGGDHFYFKTAGGERQLLALLLEYCAGAVARAAFG
jgi:pyochelin biosynthesis protein PchC